FEVHPVFSAIADAKAVTVPLVDWAFDLDAVAAAVTPATKVVVLSTPNNPTGTVCTTAELLGLLERVPSDVVVVIDEAYREFVTDPGVEDPVTAILPEHPNSVVFRTFSKAYGLANLRVGYAIGDPDIIGALDKVALPFLVNGLAQIAAIASLTSAAEAELAERVTEIIAERGRVADALEAAGWPVTRGEANFVWLPVGTDAAPLCQRLEGAGFVTRPFEGEGIRVTIGSRDENDRFLEAIGSR
ncbi:MAG: aminotransferase class I/II-fold pyridoxal phosphate-dependent enzyme, partial [Actinomycetota bacterium]|nr:aminotransferase class I/II-fold pyridoxal phosphate-dependent enzyme [Actinomycetota bacterium]